jgi:hypothetical protein
MRRRQALLVIAAVGVCLLAGWWLGRMRPTPMPRIEGIAAANTSAPAERAPGPLTEPSSHAQQAEHLAELTRAAQRGDADAAFEIAKGRSACMQLTVLESVDNDASTATGDTAQQIAERQKKLAEVRNMCIGERNVGLVELHDLWARAAQLGSPEAKYQYAINPYLNPLSAVNQLERWREWRDVALRYLNEALQSGDPRAALAFAAATKQDDVCSPPSDDDDACAVGGALGMFLARDDMAAYAYYLLDQQLGDAAHAEWVNQQLQLLGAKLTSAQVDAARQRAAELYAQVHR